MASIVTCLATSAAWCFCTASASLLSSCCGNDKPSTVPPSANSGRKRSVLLLLVSIALSLCFQWGLSRLIIERVPDRVPYLRDAWLENCETRFDEAFLESCVANQANYRIAFCSIVFFILAAAAAVCKPTANREAWPAKYTLYLFLVAATIFIPSDPLFSSIVLNVGRVGGAFFIFFQQIVIIDVSHNWNESWVEKSNQAESEEPNSGKKWLFAILASCAILFMGALGLLIYIMVEFSGCAANNVFIAITVLLIVLVLAAQLSGEEGSLLSSACVAAWASYLCYAAVSKNPNQSCNPNSGELSILSIVLGIAITIVSLLWTGWSYTAEEKLSSANQDDEDGNNFPSAKNDASKEGEGQAVGGIVTGTEEYATMEEGSKNARSETPDTTTRQAAPGMTWRLNVALAVISCWAAMVLSHWGEVQADGVSANPNVGNVSMWMIIASQWLVLALYLWTLTAPRMFPDREFS